jgi:hypothetical protein
MIINLILKFLDVMVDYLPNSVSNFVFNYFVSKKIERIWTAKCFSKSSTPSTPYIDLVKKTNEK